MEGAALGEGLGISEGMGLGFEVVGNFVGLGLGSEEGTLLGRD